jgi:large subunit ribosomal protein LP2
MKYLAAYLLAKLAGHEKVHIKEITHILSSVGCEVDNERINEVIHAIDGRDPNELIAAGYSKLASVGTGVAVAGGAAAASGAAGEAAAEEKKEEKVKETENFGGAPKELTANQKKVIEKLFKKHDADNSGQLNFDEFNIFMRACFNSDLDQDPEGDVQEGEEYDANKRQMEFLYKGMDIDGSNTLAQEEICQCFAALKENNFKWLMKILFRGADKDRSRKVSIAELKDVISMCGSSMNEEEFQNRCQVELGKEVKELTFAQFYKVITGDDIDPKTDPYDGKLKSKCCLLL